MLLGQSPPCYNIQSDCVQHTMHLTVTRYNSVQKLSTIGVTWETVTMIHYTWTWMSVVEGNWQWLHLVYKTADMCLVAP